MTAFRSDPANCTYDRTTLAPLRDGWEYALFVDASEHLADGTPICAQTSYAAGEHILAQHGFEMLTPDDVDWLHSLGPNDCVALRAFTGTPTAEVTLAHRKVSDEANRAAMRAAGHTPGKRWRNFGKWWVAGAPKGRAHLMGWWVPRVEAYGITSRRGPGFIQPRPAPGSQGAHDSGNLHDLRSGHADDGTNLVGKRRIATVQPETFDVGPHTIEIPTAPGTTMPTRSTIRLGSKGPDVIAWQTILHVKADGDFGPNTDRATKAWQSAHGLVADGIVGARSWEAAGEMHKAAAVGGASPACLAALRDANAAWPGRKRVSDGIMGDARHMASKSDHNDGNAVDITHDPAHGCDGNVISALAQADDRVTYVIWNKRIWNASVSPDWRPYKGSNGHTHHCHISIKVAKRGDDSPWPWAPR